jgi:hypothetical protein
LEGKHHACKVHEDVAEGPGEHAGLERRAAAPVLGFACRPHDLFGRHDDRLGRSNRRLIWKRRKGVGVMSGGGGGISTQLDQRRQIKRRRTLLLLGLSGGEGQGHTHKGLTSSRGLLKKLTFFYRCEVQATREEIIAPHSRKELGEKRTNIFEGEARTRFL